MHTILRVEITNFKCHKKLIVVFADGITTFVAPNGGGKSSMTQAIAWCLFGASAVSTNQESLVLRGAKECSVLTDLWLDGEYYQFVRSYSKGAAGTKAQVYSHGELLADKSTGVAEFLKKKGIDLDGFNMIYAEQGELSFFIHAKPALRKQVVASLFQIDKLDDAVKAVRQSYKESAADLENLPDESECQVAWDGVDYYRECVATAYREIAEFENELEEVKGQLKAEEDNLRMLPDIQDTAAKTSAVRAAIAACHEEIGEIEKRVPVVDGVGWSRKEAEELRENFQAMTEKLRLMQQNIRDYTQVVDRLKKKSLAFEEGTCPTCGASGEIIYELNEANMQGISYYAAAILREEGREKELKKKVESARGELERVDRELKGVRAWEDSGADTRLEILGEKIDEYNNKLHELKEIADSYPEIDVDAIDRLQVAAASLRDDINGGRQNIRMHNCQIDSYVEELKDLEDKRSRVKGLKKRVEHLEKLRKVIPLFRDTTLSQSLDWVASRASALLTTATQISWVLTIDTDLQFWVEDIPVKNHSSGQIDLICVCIRIAIAEYLSNRIGFKGLLILDGVFDRIDEDNRDAIGRLVSEVDLSQVLILSHFQVPIIGGKEIIIR